MGRNRFVGKATYREELSEGDWVEFKDRLSYGEEQQLQSASFRTIRQPSAMAQKDTDTGQEIGIDFGKYSILKLSLWIVDWSFVNERGRIIPPSRDSIANLDPDSADELEQALNRHIEKRARERGIIDVNPTTVTETETMISNLR